MPRLRFGVVGGQACRHASKAKTNLLPLSKRNVAVVAWLEDYSPLRKASMQELSQRTSQFTDSVIRRMTRVSMKYDAINLSQGFPDFDPPAEITDRLAEVVRNIRKEIISLGGEIRFNCKMTDIIVANGYIHGVKTEHDGHFEDIETDTVLLCTGHSARDTVRTLYAHGVKMMQKPFSVGARIEHPREFIDRAQ